jgi:hypothetical protein
MVFPFCHVAALNLTVNNKIHLITSSFFRVSFSIKLAVFLANGGAEPLNL